MKEIDLLTSTLPVTEKLAVKKTSDQQKKEQFCKDFESVLLERLLGEMKETIGDWGFEKDGASKQTEGLFWMYLARDMGDKGGLGLWKQMYNQLTATDPAAPQNDSIEVEI